MSDLTPFTRAIEEWKFLNAALRSGPVTTKSVSAGTARNRFAVTVLSGFLGAGKTTLLREYMMRHDPARLGLIVNDFGAVNFDATALSGLGAEMVPLSNGCSCCTTAAGLTAAIDGYAQAEQPYDHMVIEASGVSDPGAVAVAVGLRPGVTEVGIVTLVDAEGFRMFLDSPMGPLLRRQLSAAHIVVLTKTESLDAGALSAFRLEVAEQAAGRMVVTFSDFLSRPERLLWPAQNGARPAPPPEVHDLTGVTHLTVKVPRIWDEPALREHFARLPEGLLRLKGNISLREGGSRTLEWAGGRWMLGAGTGRAESNTLVLIALKEHAGAIARWAKSFE